MPETASGGRKSSEVNIEGRLKSAIECHEASTLLVLCRCRYPDASRLDLRLVS